MQSTFEGYTPQIQKELIAINEREQIQKIVNASFKLGKKKALIQSMLLGGFVGCVLVGVLITL